MGCRLLPHAGYPRKSVGRIPTKHRKVAVRPPRNPVAALHLGLIDDQQPADSLLRVEDTHVRIAHQSKQIAITGHNLDLAPDLQQ